MSVATFTRMDAGRFAAGLRSGIHRVIRDQDELNAINVFPVPDGDTGTNLSLSLGSVLRSLGAQGGGALGELLARVADDLLDGSRGNSGAIVAQFFQGVSDATQDLADFTTESFARAVALGSEYAHDALAEPREGTILSVIAAFSAHLKERVRGERGDEFPTVLTDALEAAKRALQRTPEQLDALRKAGVVDAGAKGFVDLIDGLVDHVVHGREVAEPDLTRLSEEVRLDEGADEDLTYRFCTECIVTGTDIDRRKLRQTLAQLGNSLVLAGTQRKAKIHIHVNDPDQVFDAAAQYGTVSNQKADDMHRQTHSAHDSQRNFAVITDSAADIPDALMESLDIHMVPLRVQFGDRGYLDKVSINAGEFFRELAENPVHPTTSQPTPGDFRRQYQFLASHYPEVLSVSLTGTVSGTLQAAQNAAERVNASGRVTVVNSLNASLGQGLLAVLAAECAAAGMSAEDTRQLLRRAIHETRTFAIVRDLTYAVRGGRVPRSRKLVADLLRVTPVLKTTADGRVSSGGILFGRRDPVPRFAYHIADHAPPGALRFLVGHAEAPDQADRLAQILESELPDARCIGSTELGSAIGVHAGPGALVVGIQPRFEPATDDD